MPDLELIIGGRVHGGFRSGQIELSLEQGTNTFQLSYADRWTADGERELIRRGDPCILRSGDEVMLDGYVGSARTEYSQDSRRFECHGRAKTGDLVDCSVVRRGSQWSGQTLQKIVSDIADPFGIRVRIVGDQGQTFAKFSVQRGETALSAISRAARLRGFLPYTVGGDLVLARAGSVRTTTVIRRGENVVRASREDSGDERFSTYVFKGQTRATDETNGRSAAQLRGEVSDAGVTRYRPLLIMSGGQDGPRDLGKRAILERNQRAGRGERLKYTIVGWRNAEGLWAPNTLVRVDDDWLDVSADLLIVAVRYQLDAETGRGGYVTELELTRPEAFDTGDYPAGHSAGGAGGRARSWRWISASRAPVTIDPAWLGRGPLWVGGRPPGE